MWPFKKTPCKDCKDYEIAIFNLTQLLKKVEKDRDAALEQLKALNDFNKSMFEGWAASEDDIKMSIRVYPKHLFPSASCYNLIKHFEHFYSKAYICPGGVLTIGYGHTTFDKDPPFDSETVWDESFASRVLEDDLKKYCENVRQAVKVPLYQYEFDALVSWVYNLGVGALKSSTMLKLLNKENYETAAREMLNWNKVSGKVLAGLVRRRKSENHLFKTGVVKLEFKDGD